MSELGGPAIATVVLGLLAALAGGCADFGGGLLARRTALFGVVLLSLLVGMLLAIVLAIGRGETAPTQADLVWSVLGGIAAGIGFTALYQALAVGRMGIVAPVTRVIAHPSFYARNARTFQRMSALVAAQGFEPRTKGL